MRAFLWIVYIFAVLSLSACIPQSKMQTATAISFNTPTVTSTQEFPTSTPIVQRPTIATLSTISKNTEIPTPIIERTSTPTPFLSRTLALEKLRNIIDTNLGCEFPCWAGLTPGVSKPMDAYLLLSSMTVLSDYNLLEKTGGSIRYSLPLDDLHNKIIVRFFTNDQDETLQVINLSAYAIYNEYYPQVYDAEVFHDLFEKYSIKSIMEQYGKPSKVTYGAFVFPEGSNFNPNPSRLTVLYPDKGIFIQYAGPAERTGDIVHTCLNNVSFDFWLLSPADENRYAEVLKSLEISWPGIDQDVDLQEVTGMSLDAFYEKFSSGNDQCIETPASIWPGP